MTNKDTWQERFTREFSHSDFCLTLKFEDKTNGACWCQLKLIQSFIEKEIANARADEAERCIEHCEKAFKEGFEKAKEELKILCSPLKHSEFCKKTGEQYRECALCYFENRLSSLKLPEKKQI